MCWPGRWQNLLRTPEQLHPEVPAGSVGGRERKGRCMAQDADIGTRVNGSSQRWTVFSK